MADEEELKLRAKSIYGQLEDNKKDIIRETEEIRCIKDSKLHSLWRICRGLRDRLDKQLELINMIIDETKEKEDEVKKALDDNNIKLNINTKIQQAEDNNRLSTP